MKRVLVIAYHFPPLGTGGVGRALGWARHLRDQGWWPTILAATPHPAWPQDATLLNQIPEAVDVLRVGPWDPRPERMRGLNHRELTFLWRMPALRGGRSILSRRRHDLILSTAPPPVAHAVAAALAGEFDIPWVADFRDPWALRAPKGWRRIRRGQLLASATAVVAVNDRLRTHLETSLSIRAHTVYNGYEPDEIPPRTTRVARRAVLLGTLSNFNDFQLLFRVLSDLGGAFVHIGAARDFDLTSKAAQAGLVRVRSTGYLSRAEALRETNRGSVQVMSLASEERLTLPTKIFDYLGMGGPVLCLGDRGATAEFIATVPGLGESVPPRDGAAIRAALARLWTGTSGVAPSLRSSFTRAAQIQKLARILDAAL